MHRVSPSDFAAFRRHPFHLSVRDLARVPSREVRDRIYGDFPSEVRFIESYYQLVAIPEPVIVGVISSTMGDPVAKPFTLILCPVPRIYPLDSRCRVLSRTSRSSQLSLASLNDIRSLGHLRRILTNS